MRQIVSRYLNYLMAVAAFISLAIYSDETMKKIQRFIFCRIIQLARNHANLVEGLGVMLIIAEW